MKRFVMLVAAACSVTACGMLGGKKNNTQPQPGPTQPAPTSGTASASAPPPGATQPMNPLDYRGPVGGAQRAAGPTLFTRLGGSDGIRAVVSDFLTRVAQDERINAFFRGVNVPTLERLLNEQICQATGGPCVYSGRTMRATHEGMNITEAQFNALVEDLTAALAHANVPPRESNELLTALAGMKADIVGH